MARPAQLGSVTLVWLFVVGATGMINTWADLVLKSLLDIASLFLLGTGLYLWLKKGRTAVQSDDKQLSKKTSAREATP